MFYSILGKEKCEDSEKISIFTDFNLNVCISYMNNLVKGYDLQKLYENIPKESETTKYRRKITSDMQNEEVFKAFEGMQSRWRGQFLMRKKALTVI